LDLTEYIGLKTIKNNFAKMVKYLPLHHVCSCKDGAFPYWEEKTLRASVIIQNIVSSDTETKG